MAMLPNGQITLNLVDVKIKTAVTFSYKKSLVEYIDGSPLVYNNEIVYSGVISPIVLYEIDHQRKIEAIKRLRENNDGLSLKDAKDIAEALQAHWALEHPTKADWQNTIHTTLSKELASEMTDGQTIKFPSEDLLNVDRFLEYIKQLRNDNDIGLKLAKQIADQAFSLHGLR